MKKGTSEEKIIYALRQVEGGKKATEVCREMGSASLTPFYLSSFNFFILKTRHSEARFNINR
jgi:hypothetical protein